MAGQKARIDKDSNDYLTKNARPEAEAETAYKSTKELEGVKDPGDEPGPTPVNFTGGTKKDRSRKADQTTTGTTGIGDTGTGLDKMEASNPFNSVIRSRFFAEAENPGVASAPATSDSPSLGMMAVNNTDFRTPQADIRSVLETIALQAAETFELLDENSKVPDAITNELQNTAKAISKIYEYASRSQSANDSGEGLDTSAVPKETPQGKPGVNEETEELDEKLIGKQHKIDANKNGRLDSHDFKLLRAKKTMKEATDLVFRELLKGKFDDDN